MTPKIVRPIRAPVADAGGPVLDKDEARALLDSIIAPKEGLTLEEDPPTLQDLRGCSATIWMRESVNQDEN